MGEKSDGIVHPLVARILASVSEERLESYRPEGGSDDDMLANYLWNLALSEALYPSLQAVEVTLRNRICTGGLVVHGTSLWFCEDAIFQLTSHEVDAYQAAVARLQDRGKPVTAGRIIAELRFGFWVSLFNKPHNAYWKQAGSQMLKQIFPHAPKRFRARYQIQPRLARVRDLRNRVFHHEPRQAAEPSG
ncbi:MAG: hypothetical protein QJR03_06370 [Sphaerobacter sp.]|nr:hypothetical protein [Sphaerobacter sp.]